MITISEETSEAEVAGKDSNGTNNAEKKNSMRYFLTWMFSEHILMKYILVQVIMI